MFQVRFSEGVIRKLEKLDKSQQRIIKNWIVKHLVNCENPRLYGKPLTGNLKGVWRFRIGDYRLFAEIHDNRVEILRFDVGHRRNVYSKASR